jgi:hypothetical protein
MCKPTAQLQCSARPSPCFSGHHQACLLSIACYITPHTPGTWAGMQQWPAVSKLRLIHSSATKVMYSHLTCTADSRLSMCRYLLRLSSKSSGSTARVSSSSSSGMLRSWQTAAVDADQQQTQSVTHQQQQQQPAVHVQQLTCRRCFQRFSSAENTSRACSYHPALYTGGEVAKVGQQEVAVCISWVPILGRGFVVVGGGGWTQGVA